MIDGVSNLQRIDEGGFSIVYSGLRGVQQEPVAVKVFHATALDAAARGLFARECAALRDIGGPGVVRFLYDGLTASTGQPYLVMELCAMSLAAVVGDRGPLPAAEVAAIGYRIALTLSGLGDRVHGDITPKNVLFRDRTTAQPVLSDFGLSVRASTRTGPQGTDGFAAPEMLANGTATPLADIYGLGATLYFALTGRAAFVRRIGESDQEYRYRLRTEPLPPVSRSDVPPELVTVVARMMAARQQDRVPTAQRVAFELAPFAGLAIAPITSTVAPIPPTTGGPAAAPPSVPVLPPTTARPADFVPLDDWIGAGTPPPVTRPSDIAAPDELRSAPGASRGWLIGGVVTAVLAALALAAVVIGRGVASPSPAPATTTPARPEHVITLATPIDHGSSVSLRWTGAAGLNYAVLVEPAGRPVETTLVNQATSYTAVVDPATAYCFAVQAVDGSTTVQSQPQSIRGAHCTL